MQYPKVVKIKVPYEFKLANEEAYEFLKQNLSVSNLKDLQNVVTVHLEQHLKQQNFSKLWKGDISPDDPLFKMLQVVQEEPSPSSVEKEIEKPPPKKKYPWD